MPSVETNGISIHYESFGDGRPIVVLPATGQRIEVVQLAVVPRLTAAGHRVIVPSLRGVAPSDCPDGPYRVEELARDVTGLIEALALGPVDLAGYSLGGFVAEELCYQRPDLVSRVALIGSAGRATSFTRFAAASILEAAQTPDAPPSLAVRDGLMFLLPTEVLQDNDAAVDALIAGMSGAPEWTGPGRVAQWSANVGWIDDPLRTERWHRLTTPCLVVAFEHDLFWPPRQAHDAARAMARARVHVIDGAAHGGLLTHGGQVADALVAFFEEVGTSPTD